MVIDKCPHCGASHVQTSLEAQLDFIPTSFPEWHIRRCQNPDCLKLILLIAAPHDEILYMFPPVSYDLDPAVVVNDEIRNDFLEAGLCLGSGCAKSSMVMSRRTLQRILMEQGCDQHNLVDAIAHAINTGILRRQFHSLATEIRQYGNLGAHPDDDQLQSVTLDNARQLLEFIRVLIYEYYELPAQADALRRSREGNGSTGQTT
jgi:hypothetical protein